jgi:hypothetical protein
VLTETEETIRRVPASVEDDVLSLQTEPGVYVYGLWP